MIDLMATPANLDAFLPREDFYTEGDAPPINEFAEMGLTELREQWAHVLRKPDFQRTTDDWDADHIMQFVKSFVEGDVIPGVIFWASPKTGNILVIDGAHRISAMLAWIFDDYGDATKSREFLGFEENSDQLDAAKAARDAVKAAVGAFKDISEAAGKPSALLRLKRLATSMTAARFKIQWMHADAKKAEESFYRINLRSVALNKTEIKLIRGRDEPKSIATRAIVQNAEGHPFWKGFPNKQKVETIAAAKEIHKLLFSPPLKNDIKTANLPIGGKSYAGTAMEIALEVVELACKEPLRGTVAKKTVAALENVHEVLSKINGDEPGCMGLHPAVYFYSLTTGKHQPAALMAVLKWFAGFDKNKFRTFTSVRRYFEEFLLQNSRALGEIVSTRGSKGRSVGTLISYYDLVLGELIRGTAPKGILKEMRKKQKLFPFARKLPDFNEYGKEFSTETKSAVFLFDALHGAPKCRICGARYQPDSVNADHKVPKRKGGLGNPTNLGPTHFYCNSAKEALSPLIEAARIRIETELAPSPKDQVRKIYGDF